MGCLAQMIFEHPIFLKVMQEAFQLKTSLKYETYIHQCNRLKSCTVHLQVALESAMHGRTVLVVAHRLSTIRNAGRICVLQDGHIVEQV
jgi:ABC-type transport system involved in Fe-S cluster assembly fused permease/ATPase subunit